MNQEYRVSLIRDLCDYQVRFAPRAKRLEQAERAERLLSELDMAREYPFDFIYYRVTDFRPEAHSREKWFPVRMRTIFGCLWNTLRSP